MDSLRELDWATRPMRIKMQRLERAHDSLTGKLQRQPTEEELARELKWSVEQVRETEVYAGPLELDRLIQDPSGDFPAACLADRRPRPDEVVYRSEFRHLLSACMAEARLPPRYLECLELYYYKELTMKEIGEMLRPPVHESRVSQMHKSALGKMRDAFEKYGITSSNQLLSPRASAP